MMTHAEKPTSSPVETADSRPVTLEVEGLVAAHGRNRVVDGVSFVIREGEFVTLLGPSGCGKTTTLRCVAGLHRVSDGTIRIDGRAVAGRKTHVRPERRGLNMVFQSYALWPHMTVFQNVAYGLKAQGVERGEIRRRVEEVLELVGLGGYATRSATDLSGGQQQRVVLARGLVTRPRLLLLDEPLSNLDSELRGQMRTEIHTLQRSLNLTTLYVTHDRTEALSLSDRVIVLREGTVQQVGTPGELYERPVNRFVAQALGPVNVLPATITNTGPGLAAQINGATEGAVVELAPGKAAKGDQVLVLVRPEALSLARTGMPGSGEFTATVQLVEFLGNRTEVVVSRGDLRLKVDLDVRPERLQVGDEVTVSLRKDRGTAAPTWQPAT